MSATRRNLIAALAAWLAAGAWMALAQESGRLADAVQAGRQAFEEGEYPWYDTETDALAPMEFFDSDWNWEPWDLRNLFVLAAWTTLGLLIAAIVALAIRFFRRRAARASLAGTIEQDLVVTADQVDALPFLAERSKDDLLGQARRHYQEGNYSEAIIYLFSYQLLRLDKFSVIRLAKGKTNRQYLRETSRASTLKAMLEGTMLAFEDVFFGRRNLDRARFEACWNDLPRFEQQLESATP
jgi:hypothetical protein